jgi:hypothetical protein
LARREETGVRLVIQRDGYNFADRFPLIAKARRRCRQS